MTANFSSSSSMMTIDADEEGGEGGSLWVDCPPLKLHTSFPREYLQSRGQSGLLKKDQLLVLLCSIVCNVYVCICMYIYV